MPLFSNNVKTPCNLHTSRSSLKYQDVTGLTHEWENVSSIYVEVIVKPQTSHEKFLSCFLDSCFDSMLCCVFGLLFFTMLRL